MKRQLFLHRSFERSFSRLARVDQQRIWAALERFAATEQGDVKKLKGLENEYRLRVGKWRVFFQLNPSDRVDVIGVDNRGEAY